MTIALRPWPTSICKNPGVSAKLPSAHRLFVRVCMYIEVSCPCIIFSGLCIQWQCQCAECPMFDPGSSHLQLSAYLTGRDELQWPEGSLHVWDVGLELVQSSRNVGLDLIWLGPRWRVGRDLVEGLLRHAGRSLWLDGDGDGDGEGVKKCDVPDRKFKFTVVLSEGSSGRQACVRRTSESAVSAGARVGCLRPDTSRSTLAHAFQVLSPVGSARHDQRHITQDIVAHVILSFIMLHGIIRLVFFPPPSRPVSLYPLATLLNHIQRY